MRIYQRVYSSYNSPVYMLLLYTGDRYLIGFDTFSWLPVTQGMIDDALNLRMFEPILPETFTQLVNESMELIIG